jgi:hypothetical protein
MIQLTDGFCVLFRFNGTTIYDYNKRLILLSVIQLSGGHSTTFGGPKLSAGDPPVEKYCHRMRNLNLMWTNLKALFVTVFFLCMGFEGEKKNKH